MGIAQHSQELKSAQPKLSAANLESALLRAHQFRPDSQLHCESGSQGWDYVCNYMPTPTQSPTRLQFGVTVDAMRWLQLSPMRPAGTNLPPPEKRVTGGSLQPRKAKSCCAARVQFEVHNSQPPRVLSRRRVAALMAGTESERLSTLTAG